MSERINSRLDNFEDNKAAAQQADFESELYGEAGSTDFSDEARNRVQEADAYERRLESMGERGDMSDSDYYDELASDVSGQNGHMNELHDEALGMNEVFDDAATAEAEALSQKANADPRVRRMQMIASDIARIGSTEVTPENDTRASGAHGEKQDKLEALLVQFSEQPGDFTPEEVDAITSKIINMTESAQATESSTDTDEQIDEEPAIRVEKWVPPMTAEEAQQKLEAVQRVKQQMEAEQADDAEYDSEAQAARMDERLSPISTEGLDDVDAAAEENVISTEGLEPVEIPVEEGESLEEYEARNGIDTENLEPVVVDAPNDSERMTIRDRFTPAGAYAVLSSRLNQLRNRRGERSDDSKERKGRKRVLVGLGVVAAAVGGVYLAKQYGFDMPSFGNNGSGEGAKEALKPRGGDASGMNWNDFDPSARRVTPGEGWNSTFDQMGIAKKDWGDVLKTAGPKLGKLGEAYFDNNAGEWRISRPGKLSEDALRVIASSSRKNGVEL